MSGRLGGGRCQHLGGTGALPSALSRLRIGVAEVVRLLEYRTLTSPATPKSNVDKALVKNVHVDVSAALDDPIVNGIQLRPISEPHSIVLQGFALGLLLVCGRRMGCRKDST